VSDAVRLGGVLNVVALLVFVGSSALSMVRGVYAVRRATPLSRVVES
jgi:hypothetical protein